MPAPQQKDSDDEKDSNAIDDNDDNEEKEEEESRGVFGRIFGFFRSGVRRVVGFFRGGFRAIGRSFRSTVEHVRAVPRAASRQINLLAGLLKVANEYAKTIPRVSKFNLSGTDDV